MAAVGTGRTKKTSAERVAREMRTARIFGWRLAGRSLAEIAVEESISTSRVAQVIEAELETRKVAAIAELRRLEAERLDALLAACWAAATRGNLSAVDAVLRVMARRARLLGLDAPARLEVNEKDNCENVREQLAAKLMALKAKLPARTGDDAKLIEGTVECEPAFPYTIGEAVQPVEVQHFESLPDPDPFEEVLTEDLYGEQGLFRA